MPALTLAEAAAATERNRSTILRALKRGVISGNRSQAGWTVEASELFRVFPPASAEPKAVPQDAQADALISELRAQLAEMRSQRDAWQGIAERLTLGAPKPEPAKPPAGDRLTRAWRWMRAAG